MTTAEREHFASRGKVGKHSLLGGWCPFCGAIYHYPGWRYGDQNSLHHPNQETDSSHEVAFTVSQLVSEKENSHGK